MLEIHLICKRLWITCKTSLFPSLQISKTYDSFHTRTILPFFIQKLRFCITENQQPLGYFVVPISHIIIFLVYSTIRVLHVTVITFNSPLYLWSCCPFYFLYFDQILELNI